MATEKRKPSIGFACLALGAIVLFMVIGMIGFKIKIQTMMFLSWLIVVPFAYKLGYSFSDLEAGGYDMIRKGMQAIIILAAVGALIGTWIAAGTVPTLIYGGLKIISPKYFLVTTLFLCSIVALATGTSWGTVGTAGIAMMGIGAGLGIPAGMTAGAIICGAYFGDKMSPLSDSTNLSPAVAGTDVITHIKHMTYTTVPSYSITAIIFLVLGLKYGAGEMDYTQVNAITDSLGQIFHIGVPAILPAIVVIGLLLMGQSPVTSILLGAIAGFLVAVIYQGHPVDFAAATIYSGFSGEFESNFLNKLLNRGGITSMLSIVALMMFGLGLGGMLRVTGILQTILDSIAKRIKSVGGLVGSTIIVSYLANMIGGSMSFACVMTGTLMEPLFKEWKLKPQNLSRVIEDAATLGAPLIPWNGNAIFCMSMLQVPYLSYAPYCFMNYICPIISLIYGITGFTMLKYSDEEIEAMERATA